MAVMVLLVAFAACIGSDDNDDDPASAVLNVDGTEYDVNDLFSDLPGITIMGSDDIEYSGISLSAIVNDSDIVDPDQHQYRITASDDYVKDVTWADILSGILVKQDTMSSFPDLPGKYRIRDVVSIDPVTVATLTVNGKLYTAVQPFDILTESSIEAANETYTGIPLGDLVNLTGLIDQGGHEYRVVGADGYNRTVNWTVMLEGVLVQEDMNTIFPHLDASFWVSDVVEIEVI